jgi:ABC-2 type transport system permease protein
MSDLALALRQTGWALIMVLRVRENVVFTLAFPIVLLVLFCSIFGAGGDTTALPGGGRISAEGYFTGAMAAYAITSTAFSALAISLVNQRETGQLKRLRGTPLPSWVFVVAQMLRVILLSIVIVTVLLAIGALVFGVSLDAEAIARIAVFGALGTATMSALAMALTAVTRSADTVSTVAPFIAVMLSFISGVFLPIELLPDWLATLGGVLPLAPLAEGLHRALVQDGGGLAVGNLLVPAAWALGGLVVAVRWFRWEPQLET